MKEVGRLFIVTFLLIGTFIYSISSLELESIRKNWNKKRCDPLVMMMAHLVPKDEELNGKTRSQFSTENFSFCINNLIDSSLFTAMAPFLKLFSQTLDVSKPVKGALDRLRESALSLLKPITSLFGMVWDRFRGIMYQVLRSFFSVLTGFDRVFGIATASVFAGMSMYKGIQNAINFVMYVCIVILTILVVLVILLWFALFPYVPIILTVISIIAASTMGSAVGGMSSAFCVAPGTLVATEKGWTPVEKLVPGQELDSGIVEGILVASVENASCVSIKGVVLSKTHLVKDGDKWISAGDHPLAQPTSCPSLFYCLNTSTHCWRVKGEKGELVLRDWEELPDTSTADENWEFMIYESLNRRAIVSVPDSHPGRGLVGPNTKVWHREKGVVSIKDIKINDFIKLNNESYTRVIGVYSDISEDVPISGVNRSVWMWCESRSQWKHPSDTVFELSNKQKTNLGVQLVTESGTFLILQGVDPILVRDFTEIGWDRIDETYSFTSSILHDEENQ
jgi:hypothetical protein